MKKNLIKIILAGLFFSFVVLPVFSAGAKVTYIKGKVEVSRNGEWIALKVGDTVAQAETINTGFQSEARLNLNGSVMAVPALTRVTLEKLATSDSKDTVSLYVDTGAVRSKVTHTDNKKIDYTARTAVAVASVRGTDFTITAKGKVTCKEGAVAVYSAKKYKAPVDTESEEVAEEEEESTEEASEVAETTEEAPKEEVAETTEEVQETAETPATTETAAADTPVTEGPATSTTPSEEIAANSPAGSVVVGAGQTTSFNDNGNPEKPSTESSKKSDKIKNQVNTQAEKDAAASDDTIPASIPEDTKPKTGKIKVSVVLE